MADIKTKYAASASITITLASLASSSTRSAGRESSVIDNTSNLYIDALVGGKIRAGTSPTSGKRIDVWVYAIYEDTPLYPDVLDGTDSDETITSENVRNAALRLGAFAIVDSTTDRDYYIAPFSVAALFGGAMPPKWGLFVAHDTGVNLNSTGGNHALYYKGIHGQTV